MRTIRHAAIVVMLCYFFTLDARAITFSAFGSNGTGGTLNGQNFTVGVGGSVFEIDAFVNIAGQDLNGSDDGTSAQLSVHPLPAGLDFSFTPVLSADGTDLTLKYSLTNNTGGVLAGLTFLTFLDVDIYGDPDNTFFNEFATTSGSLAPGQNFEVDEPGFIFGDIVDNLLSGTLDGTNALPQSSPEDVSMAMSFSFTVVSIAPGATVVVDILISEDGGTIGPFSITQHDSDPNSTTTITFSGETSIISDCNTEVMYTPLAQTYRTNTTRVPNGPAGTLTFKARMVNIGSSDLVAITTPIRTLTNGNQIVGGDFPPQDVPAGVDDILTIRQVGDYSDGVLSPGESMEVTHVVGLAARRSFQFFVDVDCSKQ